MFFFFIFIACQNLQPAEKPKKLLSPEEMENILTDMILLDAMITTNNYKIDDYQIDIPNFVYNKYELDSATLSKNILYYNEDYKLTYVIYSNVKNNIEEMKQSLELDKKLKDSLQRVKLEAERAQDSIEKSKDKTKLLKSQE